ncbi:MAG: zinc ribbon domain-containing protein, partial [Shewanella sp.]
PHGKKQMAKSLLDADRGMLKTMLECKCAHAGVVFEEVNKSHTTQTDSCCGTILVSSLKG